MDHDAIARELYGKVSRREISATQARTLIARLRANPASPTGVGARDVPVPSPSTERQQAVAVIGVAGRFPGADGLDAFWELLASGRSAISSQPPARWGLDATHQADGGEARSPHVSGGWLADIDGFDHAFFGMSAREAEVADPQQRLFLEAAWSALEHAGYAERDLGGRRVGVFVGAGAGDHGAHLQSLGVEPDGLSFMGNSNAILAGRVAYLLDLRGPCLTVDTACSSSLTAIHLARESLAEGRCDMAIAGGVCVLPTPTFVLAASRAGMLSPSGVCRAFDAAADGFVPGEAVASVVMKPLARALADGDHVWGVIEGSEANQDGRTNGITAPSAPSQAALLASVYERFGVDPATIGFVEAHGTGTRLGDPIEVEGLTRAFRRSTGERGFCALGSVKTAVGHTMSAAGAVGLVKVLLALAHRQIPPSLNFATPNPACEFDASPFVVNTALRAWEPRGPGSVRRAALSAFGFSGSNVHMVVSEAPAEARASTPSPAAAPRPRLALLSGRTPAALAARARDLAALLERKGAGLDLGSVCWTLAAGRSHHTHRAALPASDAAGLAAAARAIEAGRPAAELLPGPADTRLAGLGERYLAGEAIDPDVLVGVDERRRVPLPTYPFQRVSCAPRPATRPRRVPGLHPLLDALVPGAAPPLFRTRIAPAEPFLADHVVHGRPLLPGACIAEMALAASRCLQGRTPTGLADVVFRAPVTPLEAAALLLRLDGDRFDLRTEHAPDASLAAGRFVVEEAAPPPPPTDVPALRARLGSELDGQALIQRFAEAGVALGPLFSGVRRLWIGEAEALAQLGLPGPELAGADAYVLHPTLLDGAFQAGMAALAAASPGAASVLVPAGFDVLRLLAPPEPSCLAHVVLTAGAGAADRARFDVRLLDEAGRVLVDLRGFVAVRLRAGSSSDANATPTLTHAASQPPSAPSPADRMAPSSATPVPTPLPHVADARRPVALPHGTSPPSPAAIVPLFAVDWRPAPDRPTSSSTRPAGVVLVVRGEDDFGVGDAMARALGDAGVLQVVLGRAYRSRAAGVFEVDAASGADFDRLLATLKPLAAVHVLAALRPSPAEPLSAAALDRAAEDALLPTLRLMQSLARVQATAPDAPPLSVLVATAGAHAVGSGEMPDPGTALLVGLAMTAARELRPSLRVSTLDIAPDEAARDPGAVAAALLAEPGEEPGRVLALRNGTRLLRSLSELPLPAPRAARPAFREGGAYAIIGGAGGLGLALARHLAATYRARLLLVGRSPLSASQSRAIAEIEAANGAVFYARADASDPEALASALDEGRRRFGGRFDGAVQAAMVLRDAPLARMDAAAVRAVLAPKLAATANLARAIAPDKPDMLVLFSSANALVGNPGQANYAAASAGQDALGLALRASAGLPVTVIDWGYWGEVGAVASPVYRGRAAELGIGAIGTAEGLATLEAVLAEGRPHVMAMKVPVERLAALGVPAEAASPERQAPEIAGGRAPRDAVEVRSSADAEPDDAAARTGTARLPDVAALSADFAAMEECARVRLVAAFRSAGFLLAPGQAATAEALRARIAPAPRHARQFGAVLDLLERAGFLLRRGERVEVAEAVLDPALLDRLDRPQIAEDALAARAQWLAPFLVAARRCIGAYPEILAGRVAATEVLFPGGNASLVEPLYRGNPIADHFNATTAEAVLSAARARPAGAPPLRVVEVGAGTGGTAMPVMERLAAAGIAFRYRFTDVSPALVAAGRAALGPRFPQADFAVLDLEGTPDAAADGADVVVAANVLHATADVVAALGACRALLRTNGLLVINEAIQRRDFATLVFGITDGWWRFRDEGRRLPHSPLLDLEGWRVALAEAGFTEVVAMPGPGDAPAQAVLTAIAAEEAALRQAHPAPVRAAARPASPAPATAPGAAPAAARMAVRRALAEALRVPLDEIEDARSFVELGVDSIVGVDLAERLSRRLGVAVPVVALFDHPSVAALAVHIATEHELLLRAPEAIATVGAEARRAETRAVAGTTVPPGRDAASQSRAEVPIAVVGMAGRFPGARDLAGFWRNLRDGVASISDPPPGRWPRARGAPDFPAGGAWRRGGFLDTVDRFDPLPFEMSGTEADYTDPQARLFFTAAWHAFEDAGYGPAWLDGRSCGVFVGVAAGDYPAGALPGEPPPPHAFLGNAQSVLAGRLAYLLNLRGPALAVDTACSSSLVALHLACRSIAARECEIALAGGVFATSTPAFHYLTGALGMTSPTGATYAFDDRADGFVPGEGVGALVLRRLDEAVAGGDHIWGVIRATGTNQDGRTLGPTAPSARAQADLVADVLARAGLPASALDYVEAHGTGTRLGDPVEVEALARVLRNDGATAPGACVLGSVKTNIGHAGPAAGVAGVIKVLLALAHDEIPPSLNFSVPNRHIDLTGDSPLAVCDRSHPWPRRPERPRVAGVSAFGLSGTNAHALIEEAPRTALRGPEPEGPFVFPLSGRTPEALARRAAELAAWLDGPGLDARLADVAYTLAVGRRHMACRLGVVAADREALRAALKGAAHASPAGTAPPGRRVRRPWRRSRPVRVRSRWQASGTRPRSRRSGRLTSPGPRWTGSPSTTAPACTACPCRHTPLLKRATGFGWPRGPTRRLRRTRCASSPRPGRLSTRVPNDRSPLPCWSSIGRATWLRRSRDGCRSPIARWPGAFRRRSAVIRQSWSGRMRLRTMR